jgi:hypothetical protein
VQQRSAIEAHLTQGINEGGLGIGLLLDHLTKALSRAEFDMVFRVVAAADVPVFLHFCRGLPGAAAGLEEVISVVTRHQAAVHMCHLNVRAMAGVKAFLELINNAQALHPKHVGRLSPALCWLTGNPPLSHRNPDASCPASVGCYGGD